MNIMRGHEVENFITTIELRKNTDDFIMEESNAIITLKR